MENMISWSLFFIVTINGVWSEIKLEQSPSEVKKPEEKVKMSCIISGYSMTSAYIHWIRQRPGNALEWIGWMNTGNNSPTFSSSFQSRFIMTEDVPKSTQYLEVTSLKAEDSAVYFCARDTMHHCDYFDYWGQGTEVTVSSEPTASPAVFPLVMCEPECADKITLGCLAHNFFPKSLTFQWTNSSGAALTADQYPSILKNNKYTGVSLLKVTKSDWKSRSSFQCSVTHKGGSSSVTLGKKVCGPVISNITMTLKSTNPKDIFNNNQLKFECRIEGLDQNTMNEINFTWKLDENIKTENISETRDSTRSKISTLTRNSSEWQTINKVTCSAEGPKTHVSKDLHIYKGDDVPKVTIHILPMEDVKQGAEVTMLCLVSSKKQQDFYIAWLEGEKNNVSVYNDGIDFPPMKTEHGFSATSLYTTSFKSWNNTVMFSCNVWTPGGRNFTQFQVSSLAIRSNESLKLRVAMSCTDDAIDEDEYSSLWSTTSSFIFLFISSLIYSMVFSLVKVNMQTFSVFQLH
ncbi:immunoglobulin gamma-1 heavy chain-like [Pungitius pungitius]|uniref:immunoglobulin gamma-1 heavy chain-like n=1 Tax=Pungitius pungitius TaxID=134920 RepID=UPI002E132DD6